MPSLGTRLSASNPQEKEEGRGAERRRREDRKRRRTERSLFQKALV